MNSNVSFSPSTPIPTTVPTDEEGCSICLSDFNGRAVAPVVVKTKCGHRFDLGCISSWIETPRDGVTSRSCAVCRQNPLPLVREAGARIYEDSPFCEELPLQACRSDDLKTLQRLLELDKEIVHKRFRSPVWGENVMLLFIAAWDGSTGCLEVLIKAGADVNAALKETGATPAYIAAENGHTDCLKALIRAEADISTPLVDGTTPAFIAAQQDHIGCLKALIEAKADINSPRTSGAIPAFVAAQNGHIGCLKALIEAEADIHTPKTDGATPAFIAAQQGHIGCLKALIEAGADVKTALTNGATPVFMAAQQGHIGCLKALIKAGADVNAALKTNGANPAYIAARNGHTDCLKALIEAGADVTDGFTMAVWLILRECSPT